jgi:DNA-directed RNA polymerase subunit beta
MPLHFKKAFALRDNKIQEVDDNEVDVELLSSNNFFSTHINLIPMHSAVQGPRLFYGARFYNQALPLVNPDAPLVQNLDSQDKDGQSFDEKLGKIAGSVIADDDGEVVDLTSDFVKLRKADGSIKSFDLYNNFPFNRKTAITHKPLINKGDVVTKGQMLAKSNYTSDNGSLALGANARVGLVPFKGYSMDDAIVVSNSFAKRLTSDHSYTMEQDYDNDIKGGLNHYVSLFPTQFTKDQLKRFDPSGVVKPGTRVKQGDPLILATRPRVFSSTTAQLGKLSKAMRQSRHDSSQIWDSEFDGTVTDVAKTKTGYKVIVKSEAPAQMGDKIVFRSGQKGVIANILSDDHMPRTKDGNPLEVLLNPLGIPSRVNNGIIYELLLGKAAAKMGQPVKVPSFNKPGEKWYDFVAKTLQDNDLSETEEVFDPMSNRLLENPITVGVGHVLKLHHTSASKASARGQGGYDLDQQPLKGGSEAAQAKRLSGLEVHSLLSAGAYKTLKEGATLRGQKNDEYWRALRQGYQPKPPGAPFAWEKFQTLLTGAGLQARKVDGGKLRLGPFTDDDLDKRGAVDIKSGDLVDMNTMDPVPGGLFDQSVVGNNKWGKISLPFKVPNPAFEPAVRHLLGLTEKELRGIMSGQMELPEHLR